MRMRVSAAALAGDPAYGSGQGPIVIGSRPGSIDRRAHYNRWPYHPSGMASTP